MLAPDQGPEQIRAAYRRFGRRWKGDDKYRSWMPGNIIADLERERVSIELLRLHGMLPLDGLKILDVGCGEGKHLLRFHAYGALLTNLTGIDIIESNIAGARLRAPGADFRVADATSMPFADGEFDLAVASMSFSSMPTAEMRRGAAREIGRVLKPGGALLWYDFFVNPHNREVAPQRMRDIRELFPGSAIESRKVTLAPPIARTVAPRWWLGGELLGAIRPLRTHWLALITPDGHAPDAVTGSGH